MALTTELINLHNTLYAYNEHVPLLCLLTPFMWELSFCLIHCGQMLENTSGQDADDITTGIVEITKVGVTDKGLGDYLTSLHKSAFNDYYQLVCPLMMLMKLESQPRLSLAHSRNLP